MGIILLVFFLSGACALAYQIVWIRLFGLVFGGTVVSMSVVVAVFMGGLALGSHIIGNYGVRVRNRVRLYGILEITLGVVAAFIVYVIPVLSKVLYVLPFNADVHTFAGILVRFLLSCSLLLVPTIIMGGTLPLLVRAVTSERTKIVVNTGILYAVNTLGSMTGAFLVGFVLIRFLGVTSTNLLAAAVNVAMGTVALLVSRRFESSPDVSAGERGRGRGIALEDGLRFVAALGVTGFVGLALEMVWMRMMLLTFNNTIYLYSIVLTVYLFGLGLGGFVLRTVVPKKLQTEWTFGTLLAVIGLSVLAGFVLFPATTYRAFYTNYAFYSTFNRLSILTTVVFSLLAFIPVFLMGLSFPLGLGLYARDVKGLSKRLGFIYAINTAGSLVGSLAAVFVLIPAVGMKSTVILCSLLVTAPGLYFIYREGRGRKGIPLAAGISALFLLFLAVSARTDIPRSILARRLGPGEYIEYLKEGPSSTVWISAGKPFKKIWMDNLWVSSTSNEGTHALLAHYPVLFHSDPKVVCGIAFGTGQTFGTCLLYPIERITSVEIDAEIIKACRGRFTRENYGILKDPRNVLVIDDGRFYLAGTREKFDIITAEPLQPYTRGTVSLYSLEFYEACRRRLNPGGVVAQWLPVYNSGVNDIWSMIRTFVEVFDHVLLFLNGNDGILLGSDSEMRIDPSKPVPERARRDMERIFNGSVYALAGNFICSRDALLKASEGYPVITDDRPILEYTAPISHWNEDRTAEVVMRKQFLNLMEPIDPLFTGEVDWEAARKFHTSRRLINEAFYSERTGDIDGAQRLYEQALRVNPEDFRARRSLYMFLMKFKRAGRLSPDLRKYFMRPAKDGK